jgi:hypothetical protein
MRLPVTAYPFLTLVLAAPALSETLMTVEEFEAWSTGQTLDYYDGGIYWGSEQHLPGRKTLDADAEGPCRHGLWFPQGDAVCFQYEDIEGTFCWNFWRDGERVTAKTVDAPPEMTPYDVLISDAPLDCPGPDVGV